MSLVLRPYQTEALEALHEYLRTREGNPCVSGPTGCGKSIMMAKVLERYKKKHPPFRCVVLAHRKELVLQNYEEFVELWHGGFGLSNGVGIFSAGLKRKDWNADLLFASIDSIYKKSGDFQPWDLIMVDEAHRIPHKGEGKYLTFLRGCQRFNPKLRVVGWTATPFRMSTGPICHRDHLLNEICYEINVAKLIKEGYLCKLRSKVGSVAPDLTEVKRRGDYTTSSLSKATNRENLVADAVRECVGIINGEKRQHILIFCVDVAHCHAVSLAFSKHGIYAPAVTNKTKPHERDRIANDFKAGQLRAVCNVQVYTEGFNATCIDCIILLRPTLSPGLYSQMVGRGLRLHVGKHDTLVLDFASCIDEHGPIDLLGTNQQVALAVCKECRESFSCAIRICPACGWEIPKQEIERLEAVEEAKRRMHGTKASNQAILSGEPEIFKVDEVFVSRHCKPGKPDSLLVRYRCGARFYREWICLDHPDTSGRMAQQWWAQRFGNQKRAISVNDALGNLFTAAILNDWTKTITVKREGKYKRVVGYNEQQG